MIEGLVSADPSSKRTVGTVWLPPLTLITNSAAASSCSISTTSKAMPSRVSGDFSRWQEPHQDVEYIVSTKILRGSGGNAIGETSEGTGRIPFVAGNSPEAVLAGLD